MQNPVLTERVKSNPTEMKYAVEEVLVLISFAIEALNYMDSDYKKPVAVSIQNRIIIFEEITKHPNIEKSIGNLCFVKTSLLNLMKDHFGPDYSCPMKISDKEKNGIHTLLEENTGESILFTESIMTALLSVYDILNKTASKVITNIGKYGACSVHNSSPELNRIMADLCIKNIVSAKTYIKSLTYSI